MNKTISINEEACKELDEIRERYKVGFVKCSYSSAICILAARSKKG